LLRVLILVPTLTLALVLGVVLALNAGWMNAQLESELGARWGLRVELRQVQIPFTWPLELQLGETKVTPLQGPVMSWKSMRVQLLSPLPPFHVNLEADQLNVFFPEEGGTSRSKNHSSSSGSGAVVVPQSLHLRVQLRDAVLRDLKNRVRKLDLVFDQQELLRSKASIQLQAVVESSSLPMSLPLSIQTDDLVLTQDLIRAETVQVGLVGLLANLRGESSLSEGRHQWKASVAAPDLSQLPVPPVNIPAKNWKGSLKLRAEIVKNGASQPWSVEGEIEAKKMTADLNWLRESLRINGRAELDLTSRFHHRNGATVISVLQGAVDLTKAYLTYQGLFNKGSGVPLTMRIQAKGDGQKVQLEWLELKLWKMGLVLRGSTQIQPPFNSDIAISLAKVNLSGLEKIVLPLAQTPVQGELEVLGQIQGPLEDIRQSRVKLQLARFDGFSGHVGWSSAAATIKGPVQASLTLKGEVDRGELKSVQGNGGVTLHDLSLDTGLIRKEAGQKLALQFNIQNTGKVMEITRLDLNGAFGSVQVKGQVHDALSPVFRGLRVQFQPVQLAGLRGLLKEKREMFPDGVLTGELLLDGAMDSTRSWNDWPLRVRGGVQLKIPQYKVTSTPSSTAPSTPVVNRNEPPQGLLPKGRLVSALDLKLEADISTLTQGDLVVRGIKSRGQVRDAGYKGEVSLDEIFGGRMRLASLVVPLTVPRPVVLGSASWEQMNVQDLLAFTKPEYKNISSGRTQGQVDFVTQMPSEPDFFASLRTKGTVTAAPFALSTVKIGDMINGLTKKVPLLKLPPVSPAPLNGKMRLQFDMKSETMLVQSFMAEDVGGSLLSLNGSVELNRMHGDLQGQLAWAKPPVRGCWLEGNSDAQGRMLIPVAIKGNLMQPEFGAVMEAITKMGARALKCEQRQALQNQFEQQINKHLGKKVPPEAGKKLGKKLEELLGK